MSPEQATGRDRVDARSDLYSLGGVAYFLLTGQPPFVRETVMQTLFAHVYEPAVRLTAVRAGAPRDLEAVILRCLEKDAALRFQDVDSLDKALAKCRSAGRWTEERAARWWQEWAGKGLFSLAAPSQDIPEKSQAK
jgi:serine/threonine-protein kinase